MKTRSRKRPGSISSARSRQRTPARVVDPTRTASLRLAAVRAMRRRFARLKALILGLVVTEDAFGLRERRQLKMNVERIEMPQIRKEHWQRFLAYTEERTTLTEKSGIEPKSLKAVQHEFDQARVDAIPLEKLDYPILISKDGYVLDGNHRWIKAYQAGHPLKVLRLGLDQDEALALMREFPQAEFVENSFCPTGEGDGIDPSCSPMLSSGWKRVNAPDRGGSGYTEVKVAINQPASMLTVMLEAARESQGFGKGLLYQGNLYAWPETGTEAGHHGGVGEALGIPSSKYGEEGRLRVYLRKKKGEDLAIRVEGNAEAVRTLQEKYPHTSVTRNRITNAGKFQFHSSPDKVTEFQKWLRQQFKAVLLGKSDEELWAEFARKGFERGAGRAFDDINKTKRWLPGQGDFYGGTRKEFLRSSFGRPETTDKLKLLAGRSFTDLKNVTEDMATRMSRTLMDGLARGSNPRDLVDELVEDLGVSEIRAEAIARSELIRAHAEGQLDAMEKLGIEEVGVAVEWDTAKDGVHSNGRVCRHCAPVQGVVLTIEEAHGLIPQHPNCRCAWIPANVGEDDSKQIRSKAAILEAFEEAEVDPPELDDERPRSLVEPVNRVQNSDLAEFSRLARGLT